MKAALIIATVLCLQLAISPLCICLGAGLGNDAAPSCCQAPEPEERQPCPHCDQEMPLAATHPGKADFRAEAPECSGVLSLTPLVLWTLASTFAEENIRRSAHVDSAPPPPSFQATFGVFLI